MNSEDLRARFAEALQGIREDRTERTVTDILIGIQGYAASRTPVMTSNLINSQFRQTIDTAWGFIGKVGYGARYAAAVHEAPGKYLGQRKRRSSRPGDGYIWDPNGEPGFFEKGIEEFARNDLTRVIERNMRV